MKDISKFEHICTKFGAYCPDYKATLVSKLSVYIETASDIQLIGKTYLGSVASFWGLQTNAPKT